VRHDALEVRLRHTSAYVSIRQHSGAAASAYEKLMHEPRISVFAISHTSAYVSIRQSAASAYEAHARTSY
jgi:hypothetical protein